MVAHAPFFFSVNFGFRAGSTSTLSLGSFPPTPSVAWFMSRVPDFGRLQSSCLSFQVSFPEILFQESPLRYAVFFFFLIRVKVRCFP